MGLIYSTQQGPPGGGCVSPANNEATLVTKANAATYPVPGGTHNANDTMIPINTIIRCTNQGVLKTFEQIAVDSGTTIPIINNTGATSTPNIKVKRPNCECTDLTNFSLFKPASDYNITTLTFSDGYSVNLGNKYSLLKITTTGINYVTVDSISVNDYIVACQSYGKTTDVSTGCLQITNKATTLMPSDQVFMFQPKTSYPKNIFASSKMEASIMLENGVYIFTIPASSY